MKKLLLNDVGDGLYLLIKNNRNYDLTVDFGGDNIKQNYIGFVDSFLLTHFHVDHYNGIIDSGNYYSHWYLEKFYHPNMPIFQQRKIFFMCLLAINKRISNNHPIQYSILSLVKKLNHKPLQFIPVSKGDVISCGTHNYEILWPPKMLKDSETLKTISNAIEDFNEAKKVDKRLTEIYQRVNYEYIESDINSIRDLETMDSYPDSNNDNLEIIKKANTSLRNAANRLSVAFRQADNVLFLGDLEKKEINAVIKDLAKKGNIYYDIVIAPHHGTHWSNSLNSIKSMFCLASSGDDMKKHIKNDYRNICEKFIRTDEWGDILIVKKLKIKYKQ
jgi:ribonuclease BN (tRNA processing enzyme)